MRPVAIWLKCRLLEGLPEGIFVSWVFVLQYLGSRDMACLSPNNAKEELELIRTMVWMCSGQLGETPLRSEFTVLKRFGAIHPP
eukprot:5745974-Amphidinium_carterae.1